jgi:hypothetical protein
MSALSDLQAATAALAAVPAASAATALPKMLEQGTIAAAIAATTA